MKILAKNGNSLCWRRSLALRLFRMGAWSSLRTLAVSSPFAFRYLAIVSTNFLALLSCTALGAYCCYPQDGILYFWPDFILEIR